MNERISEEITKKHFQDLERPARNVENSIGPDALDQFDSTKLKRIINFKFDVLPQKYKDNLVYSQNWANFMQWWLIYMMAGYDHLIEKNGKAFSGKNSDHCDLARQLIYTRVDIINGIKALYQMYYNRIRGTRVEEEKGDNDKWKAITKIQFSAPQIMSLPGGKSPTSSEYGQGVYNFDKAAEYLDRTLKQDPYNYVNRLRKLFNKIVNIHGKYWSLKQCPERPRTIGRFFNPYYNIKFSEKGAWRSWQSPCLYPCDTYGRSNGHYCPAYYDDYKGKTQKILKGEGRYRYGLSVDSINVRGHCAPPDWNTVISVRAIVDPPFYQKYNFKSIPTDISDAGDVAFI